MRWLVIAALLFASGLLLAQESGSEDCSTQGLADRQQAILATLENTNTQDEHAVQQAFYEAGSAFMELALTCGYVPDETQKQAQIKRTLELATLPEIIAALAVGTDLESILVQLEDITADSFEGQLLYNGIDMGLDGTSLGCSVCHTGEAAPATEGTWTRIDEIRLQDPALEGYDVRRYLVESILHPEAYIPEGYANVMAPNYGSRMDLQQLANLVAYLESQDQLLEE